MSGGRPCRGTVCCQNGSVQSIGIPSGLFHGSSCQLRNTLPVIRGEHHIETNLYWVHHCGILAGGFLKWSLQTNQSMAKKLPHSFPTFISQHSQCNVVVKESGGINLALSINEKGGGGKNRAQCMVFYTTYFACTLYLGICTTYYSTHLPPVRRRAFNSPSRLGPTTLRGTRRAGHTRGRTDSEGS